VRSGSGAVAPKPVVDRHRDEIAAALRDRGLVVKTDVGLSDFRVDLTLAAPAAPDRPLVAVLLDGPAWAARRTVGDRDGLPVLVLGSLMGWPRVERVWMPAWHADREAVIARLLDALGEAATVEVVVAPAETTDILDALPELSDEPAPAAPEQFCATVDGELADRPSGHRIAPAPDAVVVPAPVLSGGASGKLAGEVPFVPWRVRSAGPRDLLDALPAPHAASAVRSVIEEIVAAEGPISTERLAKLVASAFDLARVSKDRQEAILRLLPSDLVRQPDEPFVWPRGLDLQTWRGFRSISAGVQRELDQISLAEIGNAMAALCAETGGMSATELATEALALFGGKRKTAGIVARLDAARLDALRRGVLACGADGLHRQ
jgi:hypothetical protein